MLVWPQGVSVQSEVSSEAKGRRGRKVLTFGERFGDPVLTRLRRHREWVVNRSVQRIPWDLR